MTDKNLDKAREDAKNSILAQLHLRREFAGKDGYVRQKSGEEKAIQAAKKVFGEFVPDNHLAMQRNTNNGQGANVKLENGGTLKFDNQYELYEAVVKHNREKGGFYDLEHIENVAPEDARKYRETSGEILNAKRDFIDAYVEENEGSDREDGYDAYQELWAETQSEFKSEVNERSGSFNEEKGADSERGVNEERENQHEDIEQLDDANSQKLIKGDESPSRPITAKALAAALPEFVRVGKLRSDVYYWRSNTGLEAFRDRGSRIVTKSNSEKVAQSVVDLAKEKGWTSMKAKGTPEFKQSVWMAGMANGIVVTGYKASPQEYAALNELIMKRQEERLRAEGAQKSSDGEEKSAEEATEVENDKGANNINYVKSPLVSNGYEQTEETNSHGDAIGGRGEKRITKDENLPPDSKRAAAQSKVNRMVLDDLKADCGNSVEPAEVNPGTQREQRHAELKARLEKGLSPRESSEAESMLNAFNDLRRSEAIKKHPELSAVYDLKYAASTYANKQNIPQSAKEKFVGTVVDISIKQISAGMEFNTSKIQAQKQVQPGIAR